MKHAFLEYGVLINSGEWGGKLSEIAIAEMAAYAKEHGFGEAGGDLSHSRLGRFATAVLGRASAGCLLRKVRHGAGALRTASSCAYRQQLTFTGTGESPLAGVPEFVNTVCPKCQGTSATRN